MTDRTHGPFNVGDACIGAGFKNWPELNGMSGVVESPRLHEIFIDRRTGEIYEGPAHAVSWASGLRLTVPASRLRRPPQSDLSQWIREATTTWDQIQRETGWQPVRERA